MGVPDQVDIGSRPVVEGDGAARNQVGKRPQPGPEVENRTVDPAQLAAQEGVDAVAAEPLAQLNFGRRRPSQHYSPPPVQTSQARWRVYGVTSRVVVRCGREMGQNVGQAAAGSLQSDDLVSVRSPWFARCRPDRRPSKVAAPPPCPLGEGNTV